jgi:hypothetical protein
VKKKAPRCTLLREDHVAADTAAGAAAVIVDEHILAVSQYAHGRINHREVVRYGQFSRVVPVDGDVVRHVRDKRAGFQRDRKVELRGAGAVRR